MIKSIVSFVKLKKNQMIKFIVYFHKIKKTQRINLQIKRKVI